MLYEEMLQLSDADLQQFRANADVTCGCLGHFKGDQNKNLRRLYTEVLEDRGIQVDDTIKGVFNGEGSY
jgi:hypothetical protein